jgi:glycogen synthase
MMLTTSPFIATVSRAMQERILAEPWVFKYGDLFREKYENGRFLARRNGFNMGARQRFWFTSKKSLLETYEHRDQMRLFSKYQKMKKAAKVNLQNDPCIRIEPDSDMADHVIFGMLHRICPQKGFELLVDWKVYGEGPSRMVYYEPWRMDGGTVLEHFLAICPLAQFVICGRIEDSFDGRRYDQHFRRIANSTQFDKQMGYYPEGALPQSLYRNLYMGSQFFVMPSGGEVGEPCGISQQEAHAAGTPVIAHHQDGLTRTVSDPDFGDTHSLQNGIKFGGFRGDTLLDALLDAVHIYKTGHRCAYKDDNGNPKPLKYADLSFNAFRMDHRWLRLLHDYVLMYAFIQNTALPEHLHAAQLIAKSNSMPDNSLATVILRQGLTVADGVAELISAFNCKIPSVQRAAAKALKILCRSKEVTHQGDIAEQLNHAAGSANREIENVVRTCIDLLNS